MFLRLSRTEFFKASPLSNTFLNHNAVIESIINGMEPGYVFVDNRMKPNNFFIYQFDGFFFLHGKYTEDFFKSISKYLFYELKLDCIEIILSDLSLEKAIPIIYNGRKHKVFKRKVFKFNRSKYESYYKDNPNRITIDIKVKTVNTDIQLNVKLIQDKDLITSCRAIMGNRESELKVETKEEYRRKGYALYAAKELIDQVLERNLIPIWSCWDFNNPSIGLAKKLFFQEDKSVNVYLWDVYNY